MLPRLTLLVAIAVVLSACAGSGRAPSDADRGEPSSDTGAADTTVDRKTIRTVQRRLAENGFDPGKPDGIRGPRTVAAIVAYKRAQLLTPLDSVITPELLVSLDANSTIGDASPVPSNREATGTRPVSSDKHLDRQREELSKLLDDWLDMGRGSNGLYGLSERLDLGIGKIMTGYYNTDYRELTLSPEDMMWLPAVGQTFLTRAEAPRDVEKAAATLYFAAQVIGGDEESVTGSSWASQRLPKDSEPGARALKADDSYDWRAQVKLPLGIAAYLAGAALLDSPDYRSDADIAKWAYAYLWLARENGVQDAAFLLNSIYSSGYGVPRHHREDDPLEAAWFSFRQVVDVCDTFFDPAKSYNWIGRHPMPPRPGSCERARQGMRSARSDLNLRNGAERLAKAGVWFTTIAAIASILPEGDSQPVSGNDRPSIVDITDYGMAAFIFTDQARSDGSNECGYR